MITQSVLSFFLRSLLRLHWHFRIRIKCSFYFEYQGQWHSARDIKLARGQASWFAQDAAVILSIESFKELLEDLAIAAERRDKAATSHADLLAEYRWTPLIDLILAIVFLLTCNCF